VQVPLRQNASRLLQDSASAVEAECVAIATAFIVEGAGVALRSAGLARVEDAESGTAIIVGVATPMWLGATDSSVAYFAATLQVEVAVGAIG
jgi:hypothetical protein